MGVFREKSGNINKTLEGKVVTVKNSVKLAFVLSEQKVRYLNGNKCRTGAQEKVKATASDVQVT